MQLIVVSGFLGSGKTTLLLALARELCRDGQRKVAVIENEVGAIGIDDALVADAGLPVREIYSGCICCSLRLDLIRTLLDLEREHAPDVVLLEPSGVASPAQVLSGLEGYGGEIDRRISINVVDASRFHRIADLSIPLVRDGIQIADAIVVTKTDLVTPEELNAVLTRIGEARPDLAPLPLVATDSEALTKLAAGVLATLPTSPPPVDEMTEEEAGPTPTVSAHDQDVTFSVPVGREQLAKLLTTLQNRLVEEGCSLIGHLKAILKSPGGGYLFASVTALDEPPQTKGRLPGKATSGKLTINAIVYGIGAPTVERIIEEAVKSWDHAAIR
jgi:G3E family GTPase